MADDRRGMAQARAALIAILALALLLRLWGIGFGLPHRYHIDEAYSVIGAFKTATGDFTPRYPVNSPNLWEFILLGEYGALFAASRVRDLSLTLGSFAASYRSDPTPFYLLARSTSALLGAATVGIAYMAARDIYRRRTAGLLAAAFLTVSFLHGRDSHFAVGDALVVFLTTTGVWLWAKHAEEGHRFLLVLGSFLVGSAVGLKYRPMGLVLGLVPAILLAPGSARWSSKFSAVKAVAANAGALLAGYFVAFPGLFISLDLFRWHLKQALAQTGGGFEGWLLAASPAPLFFLQSLEWGFGLPLLALALGGGILAVVRRGPGALTLLASALGFYLVISLPNTYFARYGLPLHPLVAILAGGFAVAGLDFARKRWGLAASIACAALVLGTAAIPAVRLVRHNSLLTQQDTRTTAAAWMEANLPAGAKIAVDWPVHGPPLSVPGDAEPASPVVYDVLTVGGKGLSDHPIEYYREHHVEYLVTSSFITEIGLTDPTADLQRKAFYESLNGQLRLMKEFRPSVGEVDVPFVFDEIYGPVVSLWQRERPGPTLRIYSLK